MARQDQHRQAELEPKRLDYAKSEIEKLGYKVDQVGKTKLVFGYYGHIISFFPYSGWHTGLGIKDGRGLHKLLEQI